MHTGILNPSDRDRSSGLVDGLHLGDLKLVYCQSIYVCQTKTGIRSILYVSLLYFHSFQACSVCLFRALPRSGFFCLSYNIERISYRNVNAKSQFLIQGDKHENHSYSVHIAFAYLRFLRGTRRPKPGKRLGRNGSHSLSKAAEPNPIRTESPQQTSLRISPRKSIPEMILPMISSHLKLTLTFPESIGHLSETVQIRSAEISMATDTQYPTFSLTSVSKYYKEYVDRQIPSGCFRIIADTAKTRLYVISALNT